MTSKSVIQVANLDNASMVLSQVQHAGPAEIGGDQATIILRIIDATPSLFRYKSEMISAAKLNVDALIESKAGGEMLMSTWLFNSQDGFTVLDGFVPLADVTPLDDQNYRINPQSLTNLYDTVYLGLNDPHAGLLAYVNTLKKSGLRVKATALVLTDGEDNQSSTDPRLIKDLTSANEGYYYCLMAFGTGFAQKAAAEMGFPNVREYNATKGELRKMMGEFSKSQVRASQSIVAPNAFYNN